jgi:hypothetical protein
MAQFVPALMAAKPLDADIGKVSLAETVEFGAHRPLNDIGADASNPSSHRAAKPDAEGER